MLKYKPDWKECVEIYRAWWENELTEPLVQIWSPREGVREYRQLDAWWIIRNLGNIEAIIREFEEWCQRTYFGAAAYPNLWLNLGPGVLGAFLGAELVFTGDTVWFGAYADPRKYFKLEELRELELKGKWWYLVKRLAEEIGERARGKFIVGRTDIGGGIGVLASLRGVPNMLRDMFTKPNIVEEVICRLTDLWHECYEELYKLIGQSGTSAWMTIWCPEKWYPIQCDLAYMFSPRMFRRFALPHLREHCRRLDHTIYHLDGVGQLPHVDMLLSIPELDGIQWVPGASEPHRGSEKWYPLYRKILKSDKKLVLSIPSSSLKSVLESVSHKGLLLSMWCGSQSEVRKVKEMLRTKGIDYLRMLL